MFGTIHEECGVFGVCHNQDAASLTYYGLHSLQHRGQEACGITVRQDGVMHTSKHKGLTIDSFDRNSLHQLQGDCAIGHVRYSTQGGQEQANIQPVSACLLEDEISVVHNGQIVNEKQLRRELEEKGAIFQGTSDSEVILHSLCMESGTLQQRVEKTARKLVGGFAVIVMNKDSIIAFRDPWGIRPLCWTKDQDSIYISSESCAFEVMGLRTREDIQPGSMLILERGLAKTQSYRENPSLHLCAMEYIYFSRPDSVLDGVNVHAFRKETGKLLAKADNGLHADLVACVPVSSLSAAIGYAEESGIPFGQALLKNPFVQRTFIQPTQEKRDQGVLRKLSPVKDVIKGKDIVLVDDSIVRGTTSKRIVRLLKEAGAARVHLRIASPVLTSPCFYGVDMSTREELVGASKTVGEICAFTGADSLAYLDLEDLRQAAGSTGLCTACFDGTYPTGHVKSGPEKHGV